MGPDGGGEGVDHRAAGPGGGDPAKPRSLAPRESPSRENGGMRCPRPISSLLLIAALLLSSGCAMVSEIPYYWQSARGQFTMLALARPVDEWLASPDTDAVLRQRLQLAREIRRFAATELGLPDNPSYARYADLGRPFVVWNVFAAPALSLSLKTWCFPVAGCVAYRGYFNREDAEAMAASLRAQGWDTQVAGVPAYSTLGWFDDPLLNTFIHYPPAELARLVFHELAHQVVYLPGDSTFNESFATAVEEAGVQRWLQTQSDPQLGARHAQASQRRQQFLSLLQGARESLEAAYRSAQSDAQRLQAKQAAFERLRADYRVLREQWGGFAGYDRWFEQPLGNAHLAAVATYTQWVPGFRRLLGEQDEDLPRFFAAARRLAALPAAERARALEP